MLNCDKFFVEELQSAGYDIDYKKVVEIYKKSRENPAFVRRRNRQSCECGGALHHATMIWDGNRYVIQDSPNLVTLAAMQEVEGMKRGKIPRHPQSVENLFRELDIDVDG